MSNPFFIHLTMVYCKNVLSFRTRDWMTSPPNIAPIPTKPDSRRQTKTPTNPHNSKWGYLSGRLEENREDSGDLSRRPKSFGKSYVENILFEVLDYFWPFLSRLCYLTLSFWLRVYYYHEFRAHGGYFQDKSRLTTPRGKEQKGLDSG